MNKEIAHWFHRGRETCFAVLAITSAIVFYQGVTDRLEGVVDYRLSVLIACITCALFYMAIDGPLSSMLPSFFNERTRKNWKSRSKDERVYINWLGGLAFILLFVTGTISVWSSFILADSIVQTPDQSGLISTIATESERQERHAGTLAEQLRNAERSEAERVRNAMEQGRNAVERAKKAGNPEWSRTFKNHMVYAEKLAAKRSLKGNFKSWYEGVKQAQADSIWLVTQEKQQVADLRKAYISVSADSTKGQYLLTLAQLGQEEVKQSNFMRRVWANFFILLDIISALGGVFFTFMLAKYENMYGQVVFDGSFSLAGIINETFRAVGQTMLGLYHKIFLTPAVKFAADVQESASGTERNAEHGTRNSGTQRNAEQPAERSETPEQEQSKPKPEQKGSDTDNKLWAKQKINEGWSYRDVAQKLGVGPSTIFRWVNEK